MIGTQLFEGELIRLGAYDIDKDLQAEVGFTFDPDYARNFNLAVLRPLAVHELKKYYEKELKKIAESPVSFRFALRSKADDAYLGYVILNAGQWTHATAWLGLAVGDTCQRREVAVEALRLILAYAFQELNLFSVQTSLPEYETALTDALEETGFKQVVRRRETDYRAGHFYDSLNFDILREEWTVMQENDQ